MKGCLIKNSALILLFQWICDGKSKISTCRVSSSSQSELKLYRALALPPLAGSFCWLSHDGGPAEENIVTDGELMNNYIHYV